MTAPAPLTKEEHTPAHVLIRHCKRVLIVNFQLHVTQIPACMEHALLAEMKITLACATLFEQDLSAVLLQLATQIHVPMMAFVL